jgi:oxygen-independent coproporphyrinogen-3 oxidase
MEDKTKHKMNVGTLNRHTSEMTPQDQRRFFANENGDPLHSAFDKKSAVHPGARGRPLDPESAGEVWSRIMAREGGKEKRAAYFHIPFCETPFIKSHPFHAIYLGGGTPSALRHENLFRLLKVIPKYLPLANDCEITLEGRVYHFSDDKIFACIEGGVNRFSIGVQSFDTQVRRKMGRIETGEKVAERLKYIAGLDQTAMVIDLIYGLPYQTMEIWEKDVTKYIELKLDGVDLYQLNIFKRGRLEEAVRKKTIAPPADIRMQADMFASVQDTSGFP